MDMTEVVAEATRAMAVQRVFGEPYEKDGITLVPAASVRGGGGGGIGEDPETGGKGSGGGFGLVARPAGAFVIKNGEVTWRPAIDVNGAVQMAGMVAVVALLTLRAAIRGRAKRRRNA